ncbi:MAG: hypothetical protein K9K79_01170 [Desulfohalobiaceae bacterium]|nr:hypothetical protein [Desulfohalobiaceae bacterium]
MKVLISSLGNNDSNREVVVGELNFEPEKNNFWMRCVMGDDWFQRVNSCAILDFSPRVVRLSEHAIFIVYETAGQVDEFEAWLQYAEEQVREGYRTMRG